MAPCAGRVAPVLEAVSMMLLRDWMLDAVLSMLCLLSAATGTSA